MEKIELKDFEPVTTIEDVAGNWITVSSIPFYEQDESDPYRRETCILDVTYPKDRTGLPVLLFFHGGGLTSGDRGWIEENKLLNCVIVSANYRLSPKVSCHDCLIDSAMAAAWVRRHIGEYHGDPENVFIYGSSAGAYITAMLAADRRLLAQYHCRVEDFRGYMPISGEMMTHFQVRSEQGIPDTVPVIDEMAPLAYVRKDFPPMLMITGETGMEIDCRPAENKLMHDLLVFNGNTTSEYYEMKSLTHGTIWTCINPWMRDFIRKHLKR